MIEIDQPEPTPPAAPAPVEVEVAPTDAVEVAPPAQAEAINGHPTDPGQLNFNTIIQAMTAQQENALTAVTSQNQVLFEFLIAQLRQEPVGNLDMCN